MNVSKLERGEGADVGAVGIEECEQDDLSTQAGELDTLSSLIRQGETRRGAIESQTLVLAS